MFPNLYCAGTTKAGTTTLYQILKQHSEIYFTYEKEMHFYNVNYYRGTSWYENQYKKAGNQKYIADFTPAYLIYENAPKKMLELCGPDTKFIFMLRNPVDRLYSNMEMMKRLMKEPDVSIEEMAEAIENGASYDDMRFINLGIYYQNIMNYIKVFPRENMHFIIFEEFIRDIKGECKKVFDFLGLDAQEHIRYDIWANKAAMPRNLNAVKLYNFIVRLFPDFLRDILPNSLKKKVKRKLHSGLVTEKNYKLIKNPDTCRRLMKIYKEDILKMSEFLDKDLSFWISKYEEG